MNRYNHFKKIAFLCIACLIIPYFGTPFFILAQNNSTSDKTVTKLFITYIGEKIISPTTITPKDLQVTALYEDNSTETITDYIFTSSVELTVPGDYVISISYGGQAASCTITYVGEVPSKLFTITFESNGGSIVSPITNIKSTTMVTLPSAPSKSGFWFRGWYTDIALTNAFSDSTKITKDFILYAKWEAKEDSTKDTMSSMLQYSDFSSKITADFTNHTYGPHVSLLAKTVDAAAVQKAVSLLSDDTARYFAFTLDITDYSFSAQAPLLTTISLPVNYNKNKIAVFYTPNQTTIDGEMQGTLQTDGSYSFYAYSPGTYIVLEYPNSITVPTPSATHSPSISINKIAPIKTDAQTAATISFHDFDEETPEELLGITFHWTSSNKNVATINQEGIITGKKAGTTIITATSIDGSLTAKQTVTVLAKKIDVQKLTLKTTKKKLKKKKSFQIKAVITPSNATNKTLTYSSSNKKIATVNKKGKVTAKKKGTCIISVKTTDGSKLLKKLRVTVY